MAHLPQGGSSPPPITHKPENLENLLPLPGDHTDVEWTKWPPCLSSGDLIAVGCAFPFWKNFVLHFVSISLKKKNVPVASIAANDFDLKKKSFFLF